MFRLFVGIPLPEDVRAELGRLACGLPGAKWVAPENLHITLRFIGEVGGDVAEDIDHALRRLALPPFDLAVAGVGWFETGRKVHTLWAGIDRHELLIRLQEKVETALVRQGLEPERRKFKAHVTLARFRNGATGRIGTFLEHHSRLAIGPFRVDHFTLYESHLGSDGAHYEALADYPLQG